jgi:hypothetical protein
LPEDIEKFAGRRLLSFGDDLGETVRRDEPSHVPTTRAVTFVTPVADHAKKNEARLHHFGMLMRNDMARCEQARAGAATQTRERPDTVEVSFLHENGDLLDKVAETVFHLHFRSQTNRITKPSPGGARVLLGRFLGY